MTQFDNMINLVYGPLNTSNYPNILSYHKHGILTNKTPNPPLFYSSQEPVNYQQHAHARKQYIQSINNLENKKNTKPQDSSLYLLRKKALSIGKSSYKVGLPQNSPYTTKNYSPSQVHSSLNRARSGGCVAPKKKGAVY
jgi:hypothetical protein